MCEALARSGVGHFDLIDSDTVNITNINRQIIATTSTIGRLKVDVMKERMLDINPEVSVCVHPCFFLPENAHQFSFEEYDYVVDAVDTVTAGNKLDGSAFRVADIYKTKVCPLAKVMRRELKKRGIRRLKVVYSEEMPLTPSESEEQTDSRKRIPGSTAFVPSVAGLIIAGEVVKDLTRGNLQ